MHTNYNDEVLCTVDITKWKTARDIYRDISARWYFEGSQNVFVHIFSLFNPMLAYWFSDVNQEMITISLTQLEEKGLVERHRQLFNKVPVWRLKSNAMHEQSRLMAERVMSQKIATPA